jgi:hypothetical protein
MTSTNSTSDRKEDQPGAVGAGAHPGTPGTAPTPDHEGNPTLGQKADSGTISNQTSGCLND